MVPIHLLISAFECLVLSPLISCSPSPPTEQHYHHTVQVALKLFIFNTLPCNLQLSQVTVNSRAITTSGNTILGHNTLALNNMKAVCKCMEIAYLSVKVWNLLFRLVSKRKALQLSLYIHKLYSQSYCWGVEIGITMALTPTRPMI